MEKVRRGSGTLPPSSSPDGEDKNKTNKSWARILGGLTTCANIASLSGLRLFSAVKNNRLYLIFREGTDLGVDANWLGTLVALVGEDVLVALDTVRLLLPHYVPANVFVLLSALLLSNWPSSQNLSKRMTSPQLRLQPPQLCLDYTPWGWPPP